MQQVDEIGAYVSVRHAMSVLDMSQAGVMKAVYSNRLKAVKLSGCVLVERRSLNRLVARRQRRDTLKAQEA